MKVIIYGKKSLQHFSGATFRLNKRLKCIINDALLHFQPHYCTAKYHLSHYLTNKSDFLYFNSQQIFVLRDQLIPHASKIKQF